MKPKHIFTLRALLTLMFLLAPVASRAAGQTAGKDDVAYYTCAMHPFVRSQDPDGKCPVCSMQLLPVLRKDAQPDSTGQDHAQTPGMNGGTNSTEQPTMFTVPVGRQQLIGVTYATVEKKMLLATLRTVGTVTYDKLRHWDYVSRIEGYVQKLGVSSRGDLVEKNQPLLTIYSPDLLTTQREFLDLLRMRDEAEKAHSETALLSAKNLIASAKSRLAQWNVTPEQIAELEQSREAKETLTLYSPFKGVVQDLLVDQGRRVSMGDHLVDVVDLSVVWVWAQFYQDELPLLKKDMPVTVTTDSYPDEKFTGKIALIDPFLNDVSRTVRVRMEIENPDFKLRPNMYVNIALEHSQGEGLAVPVSAVLVSMRCPLTARNSGASG